MLCEIFGRLGRVACCCSIAPHTQELMPFDNTSPGFGGLTLKHRTNFGLALLGRPPTKQRNYKQSAHISVPCRPAPEEVHGAASEESPAREGEAPGVLVTVGSKGAAGPWLLVSVASRGAAEFWLLVSGGSRGAAGPWPSIPVEGATGPRDCGAFGEGTPGAKSRVPSRVSLRRAT
jgi:hypothetical protein